MSRSEKEVLYRHEARASNRTTEQEDSEARYQTRTVFKTVLKTPNKSSDPGIVTEDDERVTKTKEEVARSWNDKPFSSRYNPQLIGAFASFFSELTTSPKNAFSFAMSGGLNVDCAAPWYSIATGPEEDILLSSLKKRGRIGARRVERIEDMDVWSLFSLLGKNSL